MDEEDINNAVNEAENGSGTENRNSGVMDEETEADIISHLDIANLTPDRDLDTGSDSASVSSECSGGQTKQQSDTDDTKSLESGQSKGSETALLPNVWREDTDSKCSKTTKTVKINNETEKKIIEKVPEKKTKNPFKILQKQLSKTRLVDPPLSTGEPPDYSTLKVSKLPQYFVVKFLGRKPTRGIHGIKHVRKQIDDMVEEATAMKKGEELPLVQLSIWDRGIQVTGHKLNKNPNFEEGIKPIEYVSYAVQDIKFYKIVSFIVVTEMRKHNQKMECHAYVCDSPYTARKLALSVSLAFNIYAQRLGDEPHKFKVDLRAPDEIAKDLRHKASDA